MLGRQVVAVVRSVLLLEVAGLRALREAAHLRWRREGSSKIDVLRVGRPAPSRIVVVGVPGDERVPEVDTGVCIHVER